MNKTIYVLFSTVVLVLGMFNLQAESLFWIDNNTLLVRINDSILKIDTGSHQILAKTKISESQNFIPTDDKLIIFDEQVSSPTINILNLDNFKILKKIISNQKISPVSINNNNLIYSYAGNCYSVSEWESVSEIKALSNNPIQCPPPQIEDVFLKKFNSKIITQIPNSYPDEVPFGIIVKDKKTQEIVNTLYYPVDEDSVSVSPQEDKLVFFYIRGTSEVVIWHYTRKPILSIKIPDKTANDLNEVISTDLHFIALRLNTNQFTVIDTKTGKSIMETSAPSEQRINREGVQASIMDGTEISHMEKLRAIFSYDGSKLVVGCSPDFEIYDIPSRKKIASRPGHADTCYLKATSDNQILTVSSGTVIDVLSGKTVDYDPLMVGPKYVETYDHDSSFFNFTYEDTDYIAERKGHDFIVMGKKARLKKIKQICRTESFIGFMPQYGLWGLSPANCGVGSTPTEFYNLKTDMLVGLMPFFYTLSPNSKYMLMTMPDKIEVWPANPSLWPLEVIYSTVTDFDKKDRCQDDMADCP